ncbi:hypothetical protein E2C01_065300 [Portunus trituberculatus]|uniref:Uncharacterized protein n=1 Tax=Portunus trituberculatus TaxID=210409 RepID=A0A5B7HLI9_PORTR|nr:hypothetical protein [Portunus trituberculatus]
MEEPQNYQPVSHQSLCTAACIPYMWTATSMDLE